MISARLRDVLKLSGYILPSGVHSPGLDVASPGSPPRLRTAFARGGADAVFTAQRQPLVTFKDSTAAEPSDEDVINWREVAWNIGLTPLLWLVTPTEVRIFDCYEIPFDKARAKQPLRRFELDKESDRVRLVSEFGRAVTESGAFWASPAAKNIDRRDRVDHALLDDLQALEEKLIGVSRRRSGTREFVQRLIGRCIFLAYLYERGIQEKIAPDNLRRPLPELLKSKTSAQLLFSWLRRTFNGDLFRIENAALEAKLLNAKHLDWIQRFLLGETLSGAHRGQYRLFKFRFDCIPSDLISSIYEQFSRAADPEGAKYGGLHYTPVELVHFVLDPVFDKLSPNAKIMDPACGSGAFLVEAFRRLVWLNERDGKIGRKAIRRILREQIFGIDNNEAALRVAAFGLYLAALEIDDSFNFQNTSDLKFDRLIGETLFCIDSTDSSAVAKLTAPKGFDAVVGNPPWTFVGGQIGSKGTERSPQARPPKRSPDAQFLNLALSMTNGRGRIGLLMGATPFFSMDEQAVKWRNRIIPQLRPLALVNLSLLRRERLFPNAKGAALALIGRSPRIGEAETLLVGSIPWTSDFSRSGRFAIGPETLRPISRAVVSETPALIKAAAFGGPREVLLARRLVKVFPTLGEQIAGWGATAGFKNGFKVQGAGKEKHATPEWFFGQKYLDADSFSPFSISLEGLPAYTDATIRWPREKAIYDGPLVLISRAPRANLGLPGRLQAIYSQDRLIYNSSFIGVSFANLSKQFAHLPIVLTSILLSSVTSFQLVAFAGTIGIERPLFELNVLKALRCPSLLNASVEITHRMCDAFQSLMASRGEKSALDEIDRTVTDLYQLDHDEAVVVEDSIAKANFLLNDTHSSRSNYVQPPSATELRAYATEVIRTVNTWLGAKGRRHLEATISGGNVSRAIGLEAVLFEIVDGPTKKAPGEYINIDDALSDVASLVSKLGAEVPPYINERRAARVYRNNRLYIVKPADRREWTRTKGLEDGDRILADHPFVGAENVRYA